MSKVVEINPREARRSPACAAEGPAMARLNERQKKFVRALFEAPKNYGSHAFAARAAGYGTATSSNRSIASIAYEISCDPKVQLAIAEMSRQHHHAGPRGCAGIEKGFGYAEPSGFRSRHWPRDRARLAAAIDITPLKLNTMPRRISKMPHRCWHE